MGSRYEQRSNAQSNCDSILNPSYVGMNTSTGPHQLTGASRSEAPRWELRHIHNPGDPALHLPAQVSAAGFVRFKLMLNYFVNPGLQGSSDMCIKAVDMLWTGWKRGLYFQAICYKQVSFG